jgi:hypothetical protein
MKNLVVFIKDMLDRWWWFFWWRVRWRGYVLGWFDNNKGPTIIAFSVFVQFSGRNGFGLQWRGNDSLELDWVVVYVEL